MIGLFEMEIIKTGCHINCSTPQTQVGQTLRLELRCCGGQTASQDSGQVHQGSSCVVGHSILMVLLNL